MISDLCKYVGQIGMRIDAVHLAGLCDGVDTGGALAASVGATDRAIRLPADDQIKERVHTLIDVLAQLGDLRLADPARPIAGGRPITPPATAARRRCPR